MVPKQLINQLGEHTDAYMLISIDAEGKFSIHENLPSQMYTLAMDKFMEDYMSQRNEIVMTEAMNDYFKDEEEEDED